MNLSIGKTILGKKKQKHSLIKKFKNLKFQCYQCIAINK